MGDLQRVGENAAALRTVDAAKPFFNMAQVQDMAREDLEVFALSLQFRTMERRTADGVIMRVQSVVPFIYGKAEDVYDVDTIGTMINAKGYRKAASYGGVKFFNPASINIDGEVKSNPYVERDAITKSNKRCFVRKVAVWRGPLGEPIARDLTLIYDPGALFVVALRGKINKNPAAIISTARTLNEPCEPGWAFFPEMDLPGTDRYVGLLAKLDNPDVSGLIKDRSDKSKFIERYADTFCERNLTKKMLNLPVPIVVRNEAGAPIGASIVVTAWIAPSDESFVVRTIEAMQGLKDPDDPVRALQAEGIIVTAEVVEATDDPETVADETVSEDANPEQRQYQLDTPAPDRPREPTPAPVAVAPEQPALAIVDIKTLDVQALLQRVKVARGEIGDVCYTTECQRLDIDPNKPAGRGTAKLEALAKACEAEARLQASEQG